MLSLSERMVIQTDCLIYYGYSLFGTSEFLFEIHNEDIYLIFFPFLFLAG